MVFVAVFQFHLLTFVLFRQGFLMWPWLAWNLIELNDFKFVTILLPLPPKWMASDSEVCLLFFFKS